MTFQPLHVQASMSLYKEEAGWITVVVFVLSTALMLLFVGGFHSLVSIIYRMQTVLRGVYRGREAKEQVPIMKKVQGKFRHGKRVGGNHCCGVDIMRHLDQKDLGVTISLSTLGKFLSVCWSCEGKMGWPPCSSQESWNTTVRFCKT